MTRASFPDELTTRHKTTIVDSLRQYLPLQMLLETIGLGPSTYYYTLQALAQPDKYILLRQQIDTIAYENGFTYGALRIWLELKKRSIRVSEKVVRRLHERRADPGPLCQDPYAIL